MTTLYSYVQGSIAIIIGIVCALYLLIESFRWARAFVMDEEFERLIPYIIDNDDPDFIVVFMIPFLVAVLGIICSLLWPGVLVLLLLLGAMFFARFVARMRKDLKKCAEKE